MAYERFHFTITTADLYEDSDDAPEGYGADDYVIEPVAIELPLNFKGKVLRRMKDLGELDLLFYLTDEVFVKYEPRMPELVDAMDASESLRMLDEWSSAFADRAKAPLPK